MTLLICATNSSWMVDELNQNTLGVEIHQASALFKSSKEAEADAWWCPALYAAHAGIRGLTPAPEDAVPNLNPYLLGRNLHVARAKDVKFYGTAFTKLANVKTDNFPARWYTFDEFKASKLPDYSWVQWTEDMLYLETEFRCYVRDGKVVTASIYMRNGISVYDGTTPKRDELRDAKAFAQYVVDISHNFPSAFTLDVGWDARLNRWVVIEINSAWSSAWYEQESIDEVVKTIIRSCQEDKHNDWIPDPWYENRVKIMGPLT